MKGITTSGTIRFFNGVRIHSESECSALYKFGMGTFCPFDKPSKHRMRDFPMSIRLDAFAAGLVERRCPHGVGHPDPDSVQFMARNQIGGRKSWGVHGCDGCCGGKMNGGPDD